MKNDKGLKDSFDMNVKDGKIVNNEDMNILKDNIEKDIHMVDFKIPMKNVKAESKSRK